MRDAATTADAASPDKPRPVVGLRVAERPGSLILSVPVVRSCSETKPPPISRRRYIGVDVVQMLPGVLPFPCKTGLITVDPDSPEPVAVGGRARKFGV